LSSASLSRSTVVLRKEGNFVGLPTSGSAKLGPKFKDFRSRFEECWFHSRRRTQAPGVVPQATDLSARYRP